MLTEQYVRDFLTKDNYFIIMSKVTTSISKYKQIIYDRYEVDNEKLRYSFVDNDCKKRIFINSLMDNVLDKSDIGNSRTFSWLVTSFDFFYTLIKPKEEVAEEPDYIQIAYYDYIEMIKAFYVNFKNTKKGFDQELDFLIQEIYSKLLDELEKILQ